jgi:flagellar basal body rod protein FlgB
MDIQNLSCHAEDNVSELLLKIISFTRSRHELLSENIKGIRTSGFLPKDLQADEFADLMMQAVDEHIKHERLVLCDSDSIRFGRDGWFEAEAVVDECAMDLFQKDIEMYLQHQMNKLRENLLNQKIAMELLKQLRLAKAPIMG